MDTDYQNYLIILLCGEIPSFGAFHAIWVYGRKRILSQTHLDMSIAALEARKLTSDKFTDIDQQGCKN